MASFINSVSSVLIILLLTASGYFFGAKKWMRAEHKSFLEKYLMSFAFPCMCIDGFLNNLSSEILQDSWKTIALVIALVCICAVLSALLAFMLRLPRNRIGVLICMGGFSNAIFVGYPMCVELFGEGSVIYVMLFFLCSSIFVFVGGNAALAWFTDTDKKFSRDRVVKVFLNPPILGAFAGLLMVIAGISLPRPLGGFIGYIKDTISPLALFYCGFVIYEAGIKNIRFDRGMAAMMIIRFIMSPLICVLLCRLFNIPATESSILTVLSAMPVITILTVMVREWDADVQYTAIGIVLSTLACFIVIPVLLLVL